MLPYTSTSNRGKWAYSSKIGALPPGQKCIVAAARERLSVCVRPGLHLVEWTRHNMDRSQIVAAYNACDPGSQVELSRIWSLWNLNVSWEKMVMTR